MGQVVSFTALARGDLYHSSDNDATDTAIYRGLPGWQTRGVALGAAAVGVGGRDGLIAHQLIGEPFANQLDEAVHHAVEGLLAEASLDQAALQAYRQRLDEPQVSAAWRNWPCLSRQLGVELELAQEQRVAS